MTHQQLNVLINSWEEGTHGYLTESSVIGIMDNLGQGIGYGALQQLAQCLYEIQCHKDPKRVANFKRGRFEMMGWKLPDKFEEVAAIREPFSS